jgi:hypothetical protein
MIKILGIIAIHFCPLGRNTNEYKVIPNANTVNKQNKQERSFSRIFLKLGIPQPPPNRSIVSSFPLLLKDITTSSRIITVSRGLGINIVIMDTNPLPFNLDNTTN